MAKKLDEKDLESDSAEEDRHDMWERNVAAGNIANFDDPDPILRCNEYDTSCNLISKTNLLSKISDIDFGEAIEDKNEIAIIARNQLALVPEIEPLIDQCSITVLGNKTQQEDENNAMSPYRCNILIKSDTKNHKYKLDVACRAAGFTVNHHWPKDVHTPIQEIRKKYLELRRSDLNNENCDIMLRPTASGRNIIVYRKDKSANQPRWEVIETINSPASPALLTKTRCPQPIKSNYISF